MSKEDVIRHLQDLILSWLKDGLITETDYNNALELLHRLFFS
jgi:hypothetical protein